MAEDENTGTPGLQTEFNYAFDVLKLIGWNWRIVKQARIEGNYVAMKRAMDNNRLDIQLYVPEMKKEFQTRFYEHIDNINKVLKMYINIKEEYEAVKDVSLQNNLSQTTSLLIKDLETYEMLIKDVIHFKKMDMPEKEDVTMAVLED